METNVIILHNVEKRSNLSTTPHGLHGMGVGEKRHCHKQQINKHSKKKTEKLLKIVQVGRCTLKTVENSGNHDLESPFEFERICLCISRLLALIFVGSKLLHPEEPEVTGGQQRSNCTSGSQVTGHDRGWPSCRVFSQIKFKIPTR